MEKEKVLELIIAARLKGKDTRVADGYITQAIDEIEEYVISQEVFSYEATMLFISNQKSNKLGGYAIYLNRALDNLKLEIKAERKRLKNADKYLVKWNNVKYKMPDSEGIYLVVVDERVASKLRGNVEISDCFKSVDVSTMTEILKFHDYVTHWAYRPSAPKNLL